MIARCGICRREVEPGDPKDACPACGYDGYTDREAHQPRVRRPSRPVNDEPDRELIETRRARTAG